MNHEGWKPGWIRGSKLEEIVWLGRDALAWCSGVHIVFQDIVRRKQSVYWCWNQDTGDGARCLSSHASYPVFAFAERTIYSRILVYSYPSMTRIAECAGGCPSGYIATAFTAGDHLVSVGSYAQFSMIVWNWRTGEKIAGVNTSIRDEVGQILRITQLGPCVIAQMGRTCGKLFTWELDVIDNVAILKDHEIKLPKEVPILWIDWCPTSREPQLAITDVDGHIYLSNYNGSDVHRVVLSQRCGICVEIETPLVSWFRDGIILRTTFCQIRFFARNARTNLWRKGWYVKSERTPYILLTHPSRSNLFFYYTLEGHLMQVDFAEDSDTPQINRYLDYGAVYRFASFIYPWCHHLVVTCDLKELTVLECYEGTSISTIDSETRGEISSLVSHPDFPLIISGTEQGELIFLSLVEPIEPKIVARLRLQRSSLDLIKFSNAGRSLIAAEKRTGDCYIVSLQRDRMYTVQSLIKVRRTIADLLIFEGHKRLRILALYVAVKQYDVGQQLFVFEVSEDQNLVTEFIHVLKLPGVYRTLWQVPGSPTVLVGSPYLTRQLRVQRLQDFKQVILEDGLPTGHQVKLARLFVDRSWITTTALDGLVLVRDKTIRRTMAHIMTHHRSDWGSVKAMVNRQGDLIVCLGYNGSLIATRAIVVNKKEHSESPTTSASKDHHRIYKVEQGLHEKLRKKIASDYASLDPAIHESLTRSVYEFPGPKEGDKTWTEWREDAQVREEEEKCREERAAILKDFEALRGKVKQLLDANEASPEIEKLPVSAFDLDIKGRDQKLKAGRDVCENLHLELEHNIFEMRRVAKWIKEAFWDPQTVVGKCLYAIFGNAEVTNYPAVAEDSHAKDHLKWANFCKKTAYSVLENDRFEPWRNYTNEELEVELNKKMKLHRGDDRRIDLLLDDDEEEDEGVGDVDVDQQKALEGTSTHRYVEPSHYYPQVGYYGFSQVMINSRLLMHDSEKLRAHFNREFDEVYSTKERETTVIRERIDRIRYIDSELSSMFGQRVPYIPADPEWHWQERPESIIRVQDHEVHAKRYVSPSQQELLDRKAAEEERIRRLLLADDFRERALMAMMDGVLEVRWEDTIKIDVPKPACMLEKKPEDYTAEDVLAAKRYEKDVQFLIEERERYKRMLEAEYGKVVGLLNEGIDGFNRKLEELFRLKLNIEAAVNQLSLRYIRGWLLIRRQIKCLEKEDELKKRILEEEQYGKIVDEQLQGLRQIYEEMVSRHAILVNRDKAMARRFKSEFQYLNKLHLELLERQYARRPRTNLRNLQASDFLDLANQVATRAPCGYLPTECSDYVKVLHNLEARPATLPPTIESSHWEQLIRTRRGKIESELKVRGKQRKIADLGELILAFEGKTEKCRSDVEDMKKNLLDLRKHCSIEELNVEFQLVLKMGQVEIELEGDTKDTEDSIFIPKEEIEDVNKLIRAAGDCKLNALSRLLRFQRGTLLKEWKHECKKKRLEDLTEDQRFLESVTVTKEMQRYLKRKAMGLPEDKTPQQLSEDVAAITRRCEAVVGDHRARLDAIQKEIAAVRCRNERLDRQIIEMNVERCEMEQRRDLIGEGRQREHAERKLRMVMRRSELIKKLQDNYAELIELQTEHELLRLRRYPTLHFRTLDDEDRVGEEPRTRSC
ncbi:cilia- and flagella-associated protein 43-like [Xylocopa sonorina]|uniref:cilia- and flagella-associated protein 43-like n=1 Tax=Xylocopa sonorina TaxID=1818115 RepID=UPI00403ABDB8